MALEQQNGIAVLHGIRNNGTPITMLGYASFIVESAKAQHKFKLEAIEDELGSEVNLIATNSHVETDISWTPSGATRAAAEATAVFLTPLARVTLSNFAVEAFNGNWIYVGDQAIDLTHKQGKMTMKIRKYDDADQNESLSTTVVG